jgi:hypothetical protein
MYRLTALIFATTLFLHTAAQQKIVPSAVGVASDDSALFSKLKYRLVGPFRGGRSAAVAGDYRQKNTFYFGGTGGGVWKTKDGGSNWVNILEVPSGLSP